MKKPIWTPADIVPAIASGRAARVQPEGTRDAEGGSERLYLPAPPDFSWPTHKNWRGKLYDLFRLATEGDIEGLRAMQVERKGSSRTMLVRYRDDCIAVLEARRDRG